MNRRERRAQQKLASHSKPGQAPAAAALAPLLQRAAAAHREGRPGEALDLMRIALRQAPQRADLLGFAGMVASEQGLPEEAARHYRAALALRPEWAEARHGLGTALERAGDPEGALEAFRGAVASKPGFAPAHAALGRLLLERGDAAAAAESYRCALRLEPGAAELHRDLGLALERAGHIGEACAAYREAARLRPDWAQVWANLATLAVEQNDPALALDSCDKWLALTSGNTEALAYKTIALSALGRREGARELLDFDRFVRCTPIEPPAGFADLAAFNRALVEHVLAHPSLKVPPADDPTYHCPTLMVSEELLAGNKGPMAALEDVMNRAVADYIAALPARGTHPFLVRRPRQWRLTAWTAVLLGEGVLLPHIHLDGYLSGVYYPQVPREVLDSPSQEGWFELGRPPRPLGDGVPEVRAIRPQPGLMLLFPAYMYHRTIPFRSPERRISIAFDVIPVGD
ncbi:MAG: tetratricopeptide repeat protein [Alphaproteobacteria bacterium]|nr:tetratricopeptide repeat protein [Alphaproteobacteria bacterium]